MPNVELMAALNFDDNELKANHQSRMSTKQIERLRNNQSIAQILMGCILSFMTIILIVDFITALNQRSDGKVTEALCIEVFLAIVIVFSIRGSKIAGEEVSRGIVASVEGKANVWQTYIGRSGGCKIRIKDVEFNTTRTIYKCVTHGKPYRIFYTPNSKRILSIEALAGN